MTVKQTGYAGSAAYVSSQGAHYPNSKALASGGEADSFDAALQHFRHGFQPGEPPLDAPALAEWRSCQQRAQAAILRAVADAPWRDAMLLRGSATLRHWVGGLARAPGDVDWVVLDIAALNGPPAQTRLSALEAAVLATPTDGLRFVPQVARDDIWLYARAQGVRLSFAWHTTAQAEAAPSDTPQAFRGVVSTDLVFGETLPVAAPEAIAMQIGPALDDAHATLRIAPPELALAWKILWLATDVLPQSKDLYDAVLLAEQHGAALTPELCLRVLSQTEERLSLDFDLRDWTAFAQACPREAAELGNADDAAQRLNDALPWLQSCLTAR